MIRCSKITFLLCVSILFFTLAACSNIGIISKNKKVPAKVIRVVDGDTVQVHVHGKDEKVRLLLVDTPESVDPRRPAEPYGKAASQFAEKKLPKGKKIQLEYDGDKRGKYGRLLAYVWVDGENFNKTLLEKGLARYAYEYASTYKYKDAFQKARDHAKADRRGIWRLKHYVHEDGFDRAISCKWARNHHQSTAGCKKADGERGDHGVTKY